jgi:propionate CoA-transferase
MQYLGRGNARGRFVVQFRSKLVTPEEAAALIPSGATIAASAMGLAGWAEEVALALRDRFLSTGQPRNLTFVHSTGLGNWKDKGAHHLAHEGMVTKWVGGHIGCSPEFAKLVMQNKCEGYCLPQGVIVHLYREIAAKRPGVLTKVGIHTFIDPRVEGGKLNSISNQDYVKVVEFEGNEYLFYKSFPINVALIRGTVADENGNVTEDREGVLLEALPVAQAAKNYGGIVIAQVEHVAKVGSLHPKHVKVPGVLVDYIVVGKPENHFQTMGRYYEPAFAGELKIPLGAIPKLPFDERVFIARRAAMELTPGAIVNLGIGIADGIASVAADEGISDLMTLTTELGNVGGVPGNGLDFGHAYNSEATIEHQSQFDWYDGGGLDLAFLGLAETDQFGNVNVSKFKGRAIGCGGFIDITQGSKKVVFCGTFTAQGLKVTADRGKLVILQEGKTKKFLKGVEQITFSGKYANKINQPVLYITERAVFTLENGEVTLKEIAPGIDLDKDVLQQMEFTPQIARDLKRMPQELFQPTWGGLRQMIEEGTKQRIPRLEVCAGPG